ncbi:MAG: hypothetical protein D8M58_19645 [Calditrichaeota bacterium]|nr:MAG: hypothetical protein DWQ03_22325 [Calditrichota bacterium]MBL1207623.1 hypothetical protein [Calditrichota bacterium]NOG47456.1 hypothetical protein [Calditrichota bacterium]
MISRFLKLLTLVIVISCADDVDLKPVDNLIRQKNFSEALELINSFEGFSIDDSLTQKRINHRKVLAEKGQLFLELDSVFLEGDTVKLKINLIRIKNIIKSKDTLAARWYYFDFFKSKARYKLLKSDTSGWLFNIDKAVSFPSSEVNAKSDLFIDVAFYYAQKNKFVEARAWLDNAIRSFHINEKDTIFRDIFSHYMNGKFNKADSILTEVVDFTEEPQWQKVQSFLNLYSDSLTMENRFRLW